MIKRTFTIISDLLHKTNLANWLPFLRQKNDDVRRSIADLVQYAENEKDHLQLDPFERALIANVLRLKETTIDDVMIPRADIVALSAKSSLKEALHVMQKENHSRMPVYQDQLDDIIGMIHIKDLIPFIGSDSSFKLESILRQPLIVAPQMPVMELLLLMRQKRVHLALVIDEYGGIDGLVSIEDLVETIVGDIADEHDEPHSPDVVRRLDGLIDIDARLELEKLNQFSGFKLTNDEINSGIDTAGGLVFRLAGRVPSIGEEFHHSSGVVFHVLNADNRHILRLRVTPLKSS